MGSDRFFFPFFWKDFQLATGNWTDEQVGAYLRLLIWSWDKDGLPGQESEVQKIGKWTAAAWRRIWSVVGEKFEYRAGRLVNARQEEIRAAVGWRSDSARASAEARWARDRADANASIPHSGGTAVASIRNANKENKIKDPPPTPPPAEGRRPTRAERKAALRAVGPAEPTWRADCPHKPTCGTPRTCELLRARAETEVPA